MATSRFIDWLTGLTQKSTTIDGTEIAHIGSSGLSQKATTKDLVSYVSQNLAQTWNAGSTVFTALKMNVTDTASSASSMLMDLQVGGSTKFKVDKDGSVAIQAGATFKAIGGAADGEVFLSSFSAGNIISFSDLGVAFSGLSPWGWSSGAASRLTRDLLLYRDAANTLAQRNGTNAQTFRLYGTYTDASNYRRVQLSMTDAGVAELKPEGAGTGATGNVIHISGLPTSNPGPGILWNNAGTPAIGT